MSEALSIELLADRPDAMPSLVRLMETEWPGWYGPGRHSAAEDLTARLERNRLPLGLAAFIDGEPVGTAALTETSGGIARPPLPWLGGLLVAPAYRRRGVAAALLQCAIKEAARLGHDGLLALTAHADALFLASGWALAENITLPGGPHRIYQMRADWDGAKG